MQSECSRNINIFFFNLIRYRLVLDEGQQRLINPTPASEPRERVIIHIEGCSLLYTAQFIDYDIKLIRKEITFLDKHTYICLYIYIYMYLLPFPLVA